MGRFAPLPPLTTGQRSPPEAYSLTYGTVGLPFRDMHHDCNASAGMDRTILRANS